MVEAVVKNEPLEPLPSQVIKARENLVNVLRQQQVGNNLYDHIVKVVDRIVQSCPDQAIERFEEISYLIKHDQNIDKLPDGGLEQFVKCADERFYARHDADQAAAT